tara:strand:+ start:1987 stop:2892 length:906 start_codon:yes stop_codon:yes gene_type:complete
MEEAFESIMDININENADYEWDFKNDKPKGDLNVRKTDHSNKTVEWLKDSLDKSGDKSKWYKQFLSKISKVNPKIKKAIITVMLPIVIGSIGLNTTDDISQEECVEGSAESDLISNLISNYTNESGEKKELFDKITPEKESIEDKSFDKFIKDVAFRESSGRWDISNDGGFMGLYQIGKESLRDASHRTKDPELKKLHKTITKDKFDKDPNIFPVELQTKVFKQLLKNNKHYLRRYYKYIGKTIGGIHVTESGLLGAAHLVGNGGVKKFLRSGGKNDDTDGNGTKCSEYLKLFSNYKLDLS